MRDATTTQTGMCAGMAVMFGPPSVGGACYVVWNKGRDRVLAALKDPSAADASGAAIASIAAVVATYSAQLKCVQAKLLHRVNVDVFCIIRFSTLHPCLQLSPMCLTGSSFPRSMKAAP